MDGYFVKKILHKATAQTILSGAYYGVLLVRRGSAMLQWSDGSTLCGSETLFIMKPDAKATLTQRSAQPLEALFLGFHAKLLAQLSTPELSLENCLNVVPFSCISVLAPSESALLIKNLASQLIAQEGKENAFAQPIYERGILEILVVLILRVCIRRERQDVLYGKKRFFVDDVFVYIKQHLTQEITLESLAAEFFVSREHIAREFKKQTGQTLHSYVLKARLSLCRQYICDGRGATDIYHLCGFSSCETMARAFKNQYNITPYQYYKECQCRSKTYQGK